MFKEPLDEQSFYSPLRMFGGGRRESRNAIPIEVKVAAISKIQSGRGLDFVNISSKLANGQDTMLKFMVKG